MALIHPLSAAAAPSCLEIFGLPDTQTAVLKSYTLDVRPISTQEGAPPEFSVRTESGEYMKTKDMKLSGRFRILHLDGTKLAASEMAVLSNLYMHTMWKQVDIKYGNQILSHPQQLYPYKCAYKVLLKRGSESKKTQLASEGYFKETAGHMDSMDITENTSLFERQKLFELSKYVDFEGRLMEDCLELDRLLLNNVPITVKLIPSSSEFTVMAADKDKKYKVEVSDLKLKVCMVTVSSGVIMGHAEALKNSNALYPFPRSTMLNQSVAKGLMNVEMNNIFTKSVPSKLVLGMVLAEAFNGSFKKKTFNFQTFNVTSISLVVNETIVGGQPLTVDFKSTTGRNYVNAYNQMYTTTGTEGTDFGNNIELDEFPKGYALFCFNMEPFEQGGKYFNLVRSGYVRLSIQFGTPLEETIVLILYGEHQDMFQIDAARNVLVT